MKVIDILERYAEKDIGYALRTRASLPAETDLIRILKDGKQVKWDDKGSAIRETREISDNTIDAGMMYHFSGDLEGVVFVQLHVRKMGPQEDVQRSGNDYVFGYAVDHGSAVVPGKRFEYVPKGIETIRKPDAVYAVVSEKEMVFDDKTGLLREKTPIDEHHKRTQDAVDAYFRKGEDPHAKDGRKTREAAQKKDAKPKEAGKGNVQLNLFSENDG
ncbi:hypothetical protein COV19_07545 [Candidatus Woesearchaeota archaeon CG10_big_fil_rev_8_21_14_0_10_44_13]|nr:MAG: hypothetical protein COV19_07545 [Candidatus Woesearchaeota archaeon CG10_big_fil_rev_8_21_14_0_10_44_13]